MSSSSKVELNQRVIWDCPTPPRCGTRSGECQGPGSHIVAAGVNRRISTHQDSIRNQEALRGADAVCQIRRQLLKMADVESVDSIASCFLRAAQVESVVDSPPYPPTVRTFLYRLPIHLRSQSHDLKIGEYIHGE